MKRTRFMLSGGLVLAVFLATTGASRLAFAEVAQTQTTPTQTSPTQTSPTQTTPTAKSETNAAEVDQPVDFARQIRPILSNHCFACHGPDEASREADLRLDQLGGVIASEGAGEGVIVAADAARSELHRRLTSSDTDLVMPPIDVDDRPTPEEIALIRTWIDQGAEWKRHWAFAPPVRPTLPSVGRPEWPASPIDRFVLARLEARGLTPSPQAPREALIRRVTLDLTGLPPTLEAVQNFLADASPGAYEKVVDRLLDSPHYGEHMARFWLDAARYGDTHGLHLDNYREMWPYRDWVVDAFNRNLPFDQFVVEQLAGDLLDSPTLQQLVATGFCRSHVTTNEGGSIEEEVYVRNVVDRVNTFGTVFMGLTVGCAACHDHKFDPFTQRNYYELFAFFNSLDGPALDGNIKDPAPTILVPNEAQSARIASLSDDLDRLRLQRTERLEQTQDQFEQWLQPVSAQEVLAGGNPELKISDGLVVHCALDDGPEEFAVNSANETSARGQIHGAKRIAGRSGGGLQFPAGAYVDLGNVGDFDDDEAFSFGAWVKTNNGNNSVVMAKTDRNKNARGYELSIKKGQVKAIISRRRPGYMVKVVTSDEVIEEGKWRHIFVTYDGSKRASGVAIYVDGEAQPLDVWSDALRFKDGISNDKPLLLGRRDDPNSDFVDGSIDEVRIYNRRLNDAEVRAVYLETKLVASIANTEDGKWSAEQREALHHFYLLRHDPQVNELTDRIKVLAGELRSVEVEVPSTLIFRERKDPREAFLLLRGQYDRRGDRVERSTPDALPPMTSEMPSNRLGLAEWLISAEHPLTSRVAVNRFWQQLFGTGLVETSGDFGNQGAVPTHPELLDWLAVEFREGGWNVKSLMKTLVMSATYCQSSVLTRDLAHSDPENRYYARGPRFRLDAETLRDQALFLAGELNLQLGGPSVKPPQPAGLWKAVGFSSSNTVEFVPDTEAERINRRSLYVFIKRTAPPPEMTTFDAPSRESPCVRRERTNTPLQALLLMNDPQYVSAAQALAARVLRAPLPDARQRAAYMIQLGTLRAPDDAVVDELHALYQDQVEQYAADVSAAERLIAAKLPGRFDAAELDSAELAAWTVVANLVLNLDEVVMKN